MTLTTAGLIWLITGVLCFLLEMAVPGFVLFFFGVGAWVTGIVCWFKPISLNIQLAIFLVSSLASLFLLRGYIRRVFFGNVAAESEEGVFSAGDTAVVVADIVPPAKGKIFYSGTQWTAIADEKIEKGSIVTIISQDGICMKVTNKTL